MASTFVKYIKCTYKIGPKQNKLQYKQCSFLHQKCTNRSNREYSKGFKIAKRDFICQYCLNYSCLTCGKHVYDKQYGVQYDYCDFWTHKECARLSKDEYIKLVQNGFEPWYFRSCM